MKRIEALLAAALLLLGLLAGCGGQQTEKPEKLVFTYVQAPLNVPSIVEKEKGFFSTAFGAEGVAVEYANITSGSEQTQAMAAGEVQFLNAVGATSVILSAAAGTDIRIVGGYSRSPGAYCVVTMDDSIQNARDLQGKTVGGPKGTTLNELLVAWLGQSGMTQEDVEYLPLSVADARTALLSGTIDAALLAGPNAYSAVQEGGRVLTTGEGLIDGTVVLAASEAFCSAYPDYVELYLQTQREILQYIEGNHDEVMALTAQAVDLPVEAVEEMYPDYTFFVDLEEQDIRSIEKTMQFLLDNGLIEQEVDVEELLWRP